MDKVMAMPKFYELVRIFAEISAAVGCIFGAITIFGGLGTFKEFGAAVGMSAMLGGLAMIVFSLIGLGLSYCFLAIVKAQIDTRNAVIGYISRQAAD